MTKEIGVRFEQSKSSPPTYINMDWQSKVSDPEMSLRLEGLESHSLQDMWSNSHPPSFYVGSILSSVLIWMKLNKTWQPRALCTPCDLIRQQCVYSMSGQCASGCTSSCVRTHHSPASACLTVCVRLVCFFCCKCASDPQWVKYRNTPLWLAKSDVCNCLCLSTFLCVGFVNFFLSGAKSLFFMHILSLDSKSKKKS